MGFEAFFKNLHGLWCSHVVGESVPQTGGSRAEGPVSHGTELSPGGFEEVGVAGAGGPHGGKGGEEFLEVWRGSSMDTLVCEDGDLEFDPQFHREPV